MARTFNDCTDAELGKLLRRRYDDLCDAHEMGLTDTHPDESWARDSEVIAAYRAGRDANAGLGKVEIQKQGTSVSAQDDPPAFEDRPESASELERNRVEGERLQAAQDAAIDDRIRTSGSADIAGDLALASALRSNPRRIRAMSAALKGYDRLK